jgi:MoxR-like ATPase
MENKNIYEKSIDVMEEVKKVVNGKDECIKKAFATMLAGGHILIEDVPGVGKTTLATAFSKVLDLKNNRVQFTPDVTPADIVGFNMYHKESGTFEYYPGTVMCNLFLADEINRTSPKTQSALLEVMEEDSVTVDGVSRKVPKPFIVMATQNPKGSAGTQLLPESQLDRFMICMSMGYPSLNSEIEIAKGKSKGDALKSLNKVMDSSELADLQKFIEDFYIHENVYKYIVKLVEATRDNMYIELGVSPRGTIACTRLAKAWAFLNARNYVVPEDVEKVFMDVAKHRIVLNTKARVSHITSEAVLKQILKDVVQPASYMKRDDLSE